MYVYYNSALVKAHFGDVDSAIDALQRAVVLDYQKELLPLDPAFDSLRDDERFKRLIEE